MGIKKDLLKLQNRINYDISSKTIDCSIDLNDKVENFIWWYYVNMVKGHYTDIGEYNMPVKVKNFIEKMAVWYELRYPDYEIDRLIPFCGSSKNSVSDVMFKNNLYINELLGDSSDICELDWDDFYNTNVFINSLPLDERYLLSRPWYSSIMYLIPTLEAPFNLYLTRNGIVYRSGRVSSWTNSIITDEELVGLHVKDVVKLFNSRGVSLPSNSELEKVILNADKQIYRKEGILNCVMYRIIERGGCRIGPRRGLLFAKEFGRSIDIPMMYGVDLSDPYLRYFINEYIKSGGTKDLECFTGYFSRNFKKQKLDIVSIQDLLSIGGNYTSDEHDLHQKLVNTLASKVDKDLDHTDYIKKLRLEKK